MDTPRPCRQPCLYTEDELAEGIVRGVIAMAAGLLVDWLAFSGFIAASALWRSPDGMFLAVPPVALFIGGLGVLYNLSVLPWLPALWVTAALSGRSGSAKGALTAGVLIAAANCLPVQAYVTQSFDPAGFDGGWHYWLMFWAHLLSPAAGGFAACWLCGWPSEPPTSHNRLESALPSQVG